MIGPLVLIAETTTERCTTFLVLNQIKLFPEQISLSNLRNEVANCYFCLLSNVTSFDFIRNHKKYNARGRIPWVISCHCYFRGSPRGFGEQGNIGKISREQGNLSLFLGNRGTKLYILEDESMVSKFIKRGTNKENVWDHGNIGQFRKGTRHDAKEMINTAGKKNPGFSVQRHMEQ